MSLASGTAFGPYEIRGRLGGGGMGEVYLAFDSRLRREVALKVLPPAGAADATARRRLLTEARLGARLEHPNLCAIYEVGEHDGRDFIAMQRIPGVTLEEHLAGRPLPEREALALALPIAGAVAHAHAQGVIHRDLKLANVMLTPDGRPVVLDFGIARATDLPAASSTGPTLTTPGFAAGTPSAMSPEQARGEPLDARTDVFSFGVLLYALLTGRNPFAGASAADTLAAVLTREPPTVTALAPGTSAEMERVVARCMAKDRDLRYASMREVAADLERLERGPDARAATAPARGPVRGAPRLVGAAALVALVVAAVLVAPRFLKPHAGIHTLAVLPFRLLGGDTQENYLGLGMADALISRVSQDAALVVRPTSAVRRYVTADVDAARAAADLKVDAVLEGTWQRDGDRLRVTANLLRTRDGASLWSDRFDATSRDIFAIQDQIADQLAALLESRLAMTAQRAAEHGGTRDPAAYEAYAKGVFYFSERGFTPDTRQNSDRATQLFAEAVRLDPGYALAHANLAYCYAHTALFLADDPGLIERARDELAIAERLDPQLGLVHFVRGWMLNSRYLGFRMDDAVREVRRSLELDAVMPYGDVAGIYLHLGLEEKWRRVSEDAIARDPTNRTRKSLFVDDAYLLCEPELGRKLQKDLLGEEPDERYWFLVRDPARTAAAAEKEARATPTSPYAWCDVAAARALEGRTAAADSLVRAWAAKVPRDLFYHHVAYQFAQSYALCGDAPQAVRWLDEAVRTGFPCYPLMQRDPLLDRVRKSPEFVAFMDRLRPTWQRYRSELED